MAILPCSVFNNRVNNLTLFERICDVNELTENELVNNVIVYIVHLPHGSNTKDSLSYIEQAEIVQITKQDKAGNLQFESPMYNCINNFYTIRYVSGKFTHTLNSADFNMFGYRNGYTANRVFKTENSALEYLQNRDKIAAYPTN